MTIGGRSSACPTRVWRLVSLFAIVAAVLLNATGCGPAGPPRHHLEGRVTFDGKPVPSGLIRFEADTTRGNSGPVGYAAIKDGLYATATQGSKGALKGPLVAIMTGGPAFDPTVEFPKMWFEEHRATLELDPKAYISRFDFDVPPPKKP